ncbi:putative nuclease HARBI1 [Trichoplusia ni]|uniref:Putative nuclease HARBI1 n=1 Tax=Trichoplusia ni TaxID=7111 RepID=A0A7E5WJP7_TRINI|nr:putative nuclease HARBI1 [Trichoplusia ni]
MARRLYALINETDSEDDDYFCPRPRWFKERPNYFEEYDEHDFVIRFRLSKEATLSLLAKIEHRLEYTSDRNKPISPVNQLLATLRFYATNNTQMSIGDFVGISTPTSHRVIHQVSAAIASLHKEYIRFPTTREEIRKEQDSFFQIARFPRVIGAMDCTHVRISSPGGDHAELYRNRKGYFSINVQTICNANLEITDIVARWPGSSHDSTIFNNSCIKSKFETGQYGNALLLVDGGYASTSYMMTPLENPRTPVEQLYNESQIRTRNPVERSYGIWKKRFPALALGLRTKLDKSLTIIVATAVLHNMLMQRGEVNPIDDPALQLPAPWDELLHHGQITQQPQHPQQYIRPNSVRDAIINNYFQSIL